jgi:hypothetical protein
MSLRFQADADLNANIRRAVARHERAIDFRSAVAAGLAFRPDEEVLRIAADDGRLLVTHDQRTMPTAFGEFVLTRTSPGALIVPQRLAVEDAAEELVLLWLTNDPQDWRDRIAWLPL